MIVGAILGACEAILGNVMAMLALSWEEYAPERLLRTPKVSVDRAAACWQNGCQQSIRILHEPKMVDQHLPLGLLMILDTILGTFEAMLGASWRYFGRTWWLLGSTLEVANQN